MLRLPEGIIITPRASDTLPKPFDTMPEVVDMLPGHPDIVPEPVDTLPEPSDSLPEAVDIVPEPTFIEQSTKILYNKSISCKSSTGSVKEHEPNEIMPRLRADSISETLAVWSFHETASSVNLKLPTSPSFINSWTNV